MSEPTDGTYTAVIDRFEEDLAVLVLEDDGETVGQHVTSVGNLPEDARKQDAVLTVTLNEGDLIGVEYREEETEERQTETQSRFDRLSQRPPRSDDDSTERD